MDVPETEALRWVLLGGVTATAAFVAMELTSSGSRHVELAVHAMTHGTYARQFWWGGIGLGLAVPALVMVVALATGTDSAVPGALAGVGALAGMFAYEDAFVRAGQSVPLS